MARHVFATALLEGPIKNPQPAIENAPSNSAKLVTINATNIQTGYMKALNSDTNEPYTTYPPDWYEGRRVMLSKSSASREHNHLPYPSGPDPSDWLNGYYDDDLWWALAWLNAYDVTSNSTYLTLAEGIFIAVSRTWGTYCSDGGIYWSWEKKYVNAIANELFFSTAAHLARRVQGGKEKAVYLNWAERSLNWFLGSGMINEHGTINDGLTEACENNNKTAWSYNQGVILGGLVELYRASSSPSFAYLMLASDIASAALSALSDENGVIHDECEPGCGGDGAQFKGVFMRNLAKLHSVAPDELYANAIRVNAASIWKWDRCVMHEGLPMFSVNWAGPWVSPANASTHSSAMDALVAAIVAK
jgi:predicted alpha-1,6-mannanase (GH76 family)